MWRNIDVQALIGWMRGHNAGVMEMNWRGGFYGLDIYNMSGSIEAVLPEQLDAYMWFDETEAVTPLGPEHHRGMPKTYPFGE